MRRSALRSPLWVTYVVLLLTVCGAAAGLALADALYPEEPQQLSFLPLDAYSLAVVLPLALLILRGARCDRVACLMCWPGVLLYLLYGGISHLLGMPFGPLMALWATVVSVSAYATAGLLLRLDLSGLHAALRDRLPARLSGGLLIGLTVPFALGALLEMLLTAARGDPATPLQTMLWVVDLAISPACLIAGWRVWRREPLGYALAPGALLNYALLFVGLLPACGYQALRSGEPLDLGAVAFSLAGCLLCAVPLGMGLIRVRDP